jgi:hypothetical protein
MNQEIYQQAIKNGCTPRMAEMLASRKCAALDTDKMFFNQFGNLGDENDPVYLNRITSNARREGYAPSVGDVYVPGLADYPGDPKAFVSRASGRGAIKKHMARVERGPESDPFDKASRVPLAEDIVQDHVRQMVAEDPGVVKRRKPAELREEVIAKHGPKH